MHLWIRLISFTLLILGLANTAWSETRESLDSLNQYFLRLNPHEQTRQDMSKIIEMAKKRQAALIELASKDPSQLKKYILTKQVLASLPKTIQPYFERRHDYLEGVLEIRGVLGKDLLEPIQYLLRIPTGQRYYLHFFNQPPVGLKTNDRIRIIQSVELPPDKGVFHILMYHEDLAVLATTDALPDAFGPQKTIVMLVNFRDDANNRPWSKEEVQNTVFKTINDMFYESSYQQTTVVGNVVGWYVLNVSSRGNCDDIVDNIATLAPEAAQKDGVDLSQYKRRVYLFPKTASCSWAGLGNIGGGRTYTNSWINGYNEVDVIGHELGHNFGLYHSRALLCKGSPNDGTCNRIEYGDGTDIMGNGNTTHFNSYQKDRLGWLNYENSPPIQKVKTSGTYNIDPYETKNQNIKALKIVKRKLADGSKDYYYLEYRQAIGFDKELGSCRSCDYTKGVIIHQGNDKNGNSSELLDMTPSDNKDLYVALLPGKSFRDSKAPNGGVTIQVVSVSDKGAVVQIKFGNG